MKRPILCAALLLLPLAAHADDAADCSKSQGPAKIEACTRLIDSGRLQGAELAAALNHRGDAKMRRDPDSAIADFTRQIELEAKLNNLTNAQRALAYEFRGRAKVEKKDRDGAIADFTRAIELNRDQTLSYVGRGLMRHEKADFDGAIADFSRVVELTPTYHAAYRLRGIARQTKGDLDGAIADFSRGLEFAPQDDSLLRIRGMTLFLKNQPVPAAEDLARSQQRKADQYAALWLYLARARANTDGARELAADAARRDPQKWPAPVAALYLGSGTPEAVLAAANNEDPKTAKEQTCEANFYVAEWHLLKDDRKAALPLLRNAAERCPGDFLERAGANVELKRLGQPGK